MAARPTSFFLLFLALLCRSTLFTTALRHGARVNSSRHDAKLRGTHSSQHRRLRRKSSQEHSLSKSTRSHQFQSVNAEDEKMSLDEAMEVVPGKVASLLTEFRASTSASNAAEVLEGLNAWYKHSRTWKDTEGLECEDTIATSNQQVDEARMGLREVERQLTQLNDRMLSLQTGMDRSLAEVESIRSQFTKHRSLCAQNRNHTNIMLSGLAIDLPLAQQLSTLIATECNGDTPPAITECSLPDGSFVTTFKETAKQELVRKLSGVSERLVSLHLDRAVHGSSSSTSLLQLRHGKRRFRGGKGSSFSLLQRLRRRGSHKRQVALLQRTSSWAALPDNLESDWCADATAPSCAGLVDVMKTFVGNVDDLSDEIKERGQADAVDCEKSLGAYDLQVKDLTRQADEAGLAMANIAGERGDLNSLHKDRNNQFLNVGKEVKERIGKCTEHENDADLQMCSAKRVWQSMDTSGSFLGDCEVTEWLREPCTQVCGSDGTQNLTRHIIKKPAHSTLCPVLELVRACNRKPCPVDGLMDRWEEWSQCSRACGGGTRTRHRVILRKAENGGLPLGETMQAQICNNMPCDQDCVLGNWSQWSACSKACQGGHQSRVHTLRFAAIGEGTCAAPDHPTRLERAGCNREQCSSSSPQCASKLDLVLAVDVSGSIGTAGLTALQSFATEVVSRSQPSLTDGSRIGVISFADAATVDLQLSSTLSDVEASIGAISLQATGTDTGQALALARGILERRGSDLLTRPVVVVITDGMPIRSRIVAEEAKQLREAGMRLVFVTVGAALSTRALQGWVSSPWQENIVAANSFASLGSDKATELIVNLCPVLA